MTDHNLIIFDINAPHFKNNRIMDPAFAARYPGASVIPCLREKAKEIGWEMITSDVFLKNPPKFRRAVCLSSEVTPALKQLIQKEVIPAVLTCGESPGVSWRFYHNLKKNSAFFRHVALFRGMESRSCATYFHPWYWPNPHRVINIGLPWKQRKLICIVASCKAQVGANWAKWESRCLRLPRLVRLKWQQSIDPFLRVQSLYESRLFVIERLAAEKEFAIFGFGWDSAMVNWRRIRKIRFYHTPCSCKDKLETMAKFRFALCFENCVFPGYVTEKIFDCFFASCVPVYWGAPDITDFVPKECFIDFRQFSSVEQMWQFLKDLTDTQWQSYHKAIDEYLRSDLFVPFTDDAVAGNLLRWLTQECE